MNTLNIYLKADIEEISGGEVDYNYDVKFTKYLRLKDSLKLGATNGIVTTSAKIFASMIDMEKGESRTVYGIVQFTRTRENGVTTLKYTPVDKIGIESIEVSGSSNKEASDNALPKLVSVFEYTMGKLLEQIQTMLKESGVG